MGDVLRLNLLEDSRRWFRDRDARAEVETRGTTNELAAAGHTYDGIMRTQLERVKRQALHDYRAGYPGSVASTVNCAATKGGSMDS